jgi:hypothetical protein
MNAVVLLAAGVDVVAIGIVIVFIIIPLIGVVASKMREIVQPGNPLPPDRTDSGRIQEQIDEFLRRAAQRRGGQPAAETPQPVEVVAEEDAPVGGRVGQQVQKYMDTSDFRRRSEELGGEVAQSDQQFTQQVGQAFSGQVGRLASRPGEAAQPVDAIEAEAAGPEYLSRPTLDALPVAGSGLAELLGSPENIAQAVIMSEILRRPDF